MMGSANRFRNGEPEPAAAGIARAGSLTASKTLKHLRQIILCNARPRILKSQHDFLCGLFETNAHSIALATITKHIFDKYAEYLT